MRTASPLIVLLLAMLPAGPAFAQFIPDPAKFRTQVISRTTTERNWPFSVDTGLLACVWDFGQRMTFFIEDLPPGPDRRQLFLSVNPLMLLVGNLPNRSLFAEGLTDEQIVRQTMHYLVIAEKLCDLPPGTHLRDGAT